MEEQIQKKNLFKATGEFFGKCVRVFKVARKPTSEEVKQVSKISALGILAIGAIGFIIGIIYILIFT
ncbi:MAG: protein translocase SEC61 complex subunit gamma [Candidatus Pacearchaeota archaeon]